MGDRVAPFDDAVHDVVGVILLVCTKRLGGGGGGRGQNHEGVFRIVLCHFLNHRVIVYSVPGDIGGRLLRELVHTGFMSLLRDPLKSSLVTCSFSALSMSTSTVDVA